MNAGRVPFEAPKERSRVCFGGFRPTKLVEESRGLARGAPLLRTSISLIFSPAVLITAYRPDPERWSDDFMRRKQ